MEGSLAAMIGLVLIAVVCGSLFFGKKHCAKERGSPTPEEFERAKKDVMNL